MPIQKLLGLRYHDPDQNPEVFQAHNVPWEEFVEIFVKPYWTHTPEICDNENLQNNDLLKAEFTGDATWIQLGTADDINAEPIQVNALVIEIANLSHTQLQDRLEGIAAIAHTLFLHSPTEPSWRVIVPLAKSIDVTRANKAAKQLYNDLLSDGTIYNDTDQGDPFCRPGCLSNLADHFDHFKIDGNFVDVEAVLSGVKSWNGTPISSTSSSQTNKLERSSDPAPMLHVSDADLRSELEGLYASFAIPEDFSDASERLYELEFELNRRQKWAPAFRPSFPIPYLRSALKPAHKLIQQARVVIDCHWLHTQCQKRQAVKEAKWQALLDPGMDFSNDLAQDFAARAIAGTVRADEILCLTPIQQLQTRALNGRKIAEARKKATNATSSSKSPLAKTLGAINQWSASDPRLHAEKYEALTRVMFMLDGSKHTNTDVGLLTGLALGCPPFKKTKFGP